MNLLRGSHNRNMKVVLMTALILLLANHAFPQQIATIDLTRSHESPKQTKKQKETPPPKGCSCPGGAMYDGIVQPPDKQPRDISLELTKLSDINPAVGSEVVAEIQLKNIGKNSISIPWSTHPGVITKGQNPDSVQWEQGGFEVLLRDRRQNGFVLQSPDLPLYGSKFSAGSLLTIQPGEWVIARMNFKIADRFFGTPEGESRLSVKWEQASRTWTRGKCGATTGWFDYNGEFYRQERPAVTIQIADSGPIKNGTANQ
jgi:hypothetical protein